MRKSYRAVAIVCVGLAPVAGLALLRSAFAAPILVYKDEVRRLKIRMAKSAEQGRELRKKARSLSRWITDPARMIWLKIGELHQRDRLEAALRSAEAHLLVRQQWLASAEGKIWIDQEGRAPEWRQVRSEERRLRRHVRRAEREAAAALAAARQAAGLSQIVYGRSGVATGIDLPDQPQSQKHYLGEINRKLLDAVQSLPPDLSAKLSKTLDKGRGQAD